MNNRSGVCKHGNYVSKGRNTSIESKIRQLSTAKDFFYDKRVVKESNPFGFILLYILMKAHMLDSFAVSLYTVALFYF